MQSDVTTCMTDLDQLSRTQAQLAWKIGDRLLMIRGEVGNEPGWVAALRRRYPESVGAFSPTDITLYMGAAEAFGDEERKLGLAWCMYAYCLRHTASPSTWITRAGRERWTFGDLRNQILSEEPRQTRNKVSSNREPLPPVCLVEQPLQNRAGQQIGKISCHISMNDIRVEPRLVVEINEGCALYLDEAEALSEVLDTCINDVRIFLGAAGLTVEAPDLNALTARAA